MSKNPYENLRVLKKFVKRECEKLQKSDKTFKDIYNIVLKKSYIIRISISEDFMKIAGLDLSISSSGIIIEEIDDNFEKINISNGVEIVF